jgi:predicted GIY-YIG superfamily endonuclease
MIRVEPIPQPPDPFGEPTWYAYLVVHPVTKTPIYVGMTSDIVTRTAAHKAPNSPVRSLLGGLIPEVQIVGQYETQAEALEHEVTLINEIPGLLNERGDRATGRPRLGEEHKTIEFNKPWEAAGISRRTWYARQAEKRKAKP